MQGEWGISDEAEFGARLRCLRVEEVLLPYPTCVHGSLRSYNGLMQRGLLLALLLIALQGVAGTTRRLILKDGSYQSVQKYEIKGDNVHYLSAERNEWEDIPNSMIDWDATKKYEEDLEKKSKADQKPSPEEAAKIQAQQSAEARTPEVAANLKLPETGGVFALDEKQGKPFLVELTTHTSHDVGHTARDVILKKVNPIAGHKVTIELNGAHSPVRVTSPRPVFYLNPNKDPDTGEKLDIVSPRTSADAYRYSILKLDSNHNNRLVATVMTDIASQQTQNEKLIPVIAQLASGGIWVQIEPKQDLAPGEYAVVEMTGEATFSAYVWDFGIGGSADEKPAGKKSGKSKH